MPRRSARRPDNAGPGTLPPMLESDLRRAILCDRKAQVMHGALVTDCPGDCIAHLLGWHGMYVTPLQSKHGWRTPTRGDMGPGWPDLVLVSPRRKRVAFVELKRDGAEPRHDQLAVGHVLERSGLEYHVWRPADLDDGTILAELQHA